MKIYPDKLKHGDEVRIIAPALSLKIISQDNINFANKMLAELGLKVSFGKHVNEQDMFDSSSIESRIEDIHDAFQDKNVKAILCVIGGANANQLLKYIDYDLIKMNPKILCGFSDINVLQNAIYQKTGLVTYSGPQYSSFAMQKDFDYTLDYFKRILFNENSIEVIPSKTWSDDAWFLDQENRVFHVNEGCWIVHSGEAVGTIMGGNISTFQLLHGTSFMPSLIDSVLFLEADTINEEHGVGEFDRQLQSIIHQPNFDKVKAILFGRFEKKFGMDITKLTAIINSKKELNNIPILANLDFGHTMPMITFPIGGICKIRATEESVFIEISDL